MTSVIGLPSPTRGQCAEALNQMVTHQRVTSGTRQTLQALEPLFARKVYDQIEVALGKLLDRLTVSGERGTDYFEVQLLRIKNWTRQGSYDKVTNTFRTWLMETHGVDVAIEFERWATTNQRLADFDAEVSRYLKEGTTPKDCLEVTLRTIQGLRRLPNDEPNALEASLQTLAQAMRQ